MKIAIIADLHDNEVYLDAFLKNDDSDILLMCGDIGNSDTMKKISESSYQKIYFVYGNADTVAEKDIPKNIINLDQAGIIELGNKKIGLCHEPVKIKKLLLEKPYIIFYGHTHRPWFETKEKVLVVNPGSLGSTPSCYAVWDLTRPAPELVRIETTL